MFKHNSLLLVIILSLFTFISCRPSENKKVETNEPIIIKIGNTDSSSRSTNIWSVELGKILEEKAPGKFQVEVYPDGQLGDTPDLVAGVKLGTVTMMFDLSAAITAAAGPESACIDLPYLYPTYEDWVKGTFENGGLELFNEYLKKQGYYCIDMYYNGMRQVASVKRNYHNSNDLKGQKIRIAQNELNVDMWQAMGANPTPMSWGEVITSLSQGTIDALDHSLGVFNDFSLHKIAPYITLTNHASSPFPIVCSLDWINSLPEDLRQILEESIHEVAKKQREEERANELKYIERFKSEGATVQELTSDEVKAFQESVKPVYDKWRKKVGDDVVDKWLETVPKK